MPAKDMDDSHFQSVNPANDGPHALRRPGIGNAFPFSTVRVTGVVEGREQEVQLLSACINALHETDTERRFEALLRALGLMEALKEDPNSAAIVREQKGILLGSVGEVLLARRQGNSAQNRKDGIGYYKCALQHFEAVGDVYNELKTLYNLADAYASGPDVDARVELPLAMSCLREVIARATGAEDREMSIAARINFASHASRLNTPEGPEWVEEAICHLTEVIGAVANDASRWAIMQNALGALYAKRQTGEARANLEAAIGCIQASLKVRRKEYEPEAWAISTANLIQLQERYSASFDGGTSPGGEIDDVGDEAIEVLIQAGRPLVAGGVAVRLARIALWRAKKGNEQQALRARECLHRALGIFMPQGALADQVEALRLLFEVELRLGDRRAAAQNGLHALFVSAQLELGGFELERLVEISRTLGDLHVRVAMIFIELREGASALQALELGRARFLRASLRVQGPEYGEVQRSIREMRSAILTMERELSGDAAAQPRRKLQEFAELREQLALLVNSGVGQSVSETWDAARRLLTAFDAMVIPLVAGGNAAIAILTRGEGDSVLSAAQLERHPGTILTRWNAACEQYVGADIRSFMAAIDAIGDDLWDLFGETMVGGLLRRGVPLGARVVILPPASLGGLPLGLAREPDSGARLFEMYELSIAPNIGSLAAGERTADVPSLAAIVNPTNDLPHSELEIAAISWLLPEERRKVLHGSLCSLDRSLDLLSSGNYWLMIAHGMFNQEDPRLSGLVLSSGETLSIDDLITSKHLCAPRLVALSACETGLHGIEEEFVGLPVAFLQLGAGAVLSTLWRVDDASTALLVSRFFRSHLEQGVRPAAALQEAQLWLRGLTVGEYRAIVEALLDSNPSLAREERVRELGEALVGADQDATPFAHPYFWGGFVLHGA